MNKYYPPPIKGFLSLSVLIAMSTHSFATQAGQSLTLSESVAKELPAILTLYKTIHEAPELAYTEENTSALVAKSLKSDGCEVITGIGKYPDAGHKGYGVAGVLKNGEGPVVLVRCELDALPLTEDTGLAYSSKIAGISHTCGHDIHVANMLGTARILAARKDQWSGTIVFLAQPAEETLEGAKAMIDDGLFTKVPIPDYCLALHDTGLLAVGTVGICSGPALMSVQAVKITVQGVGGQAASPDQTKDPVALTAAIIVGLQTIVSRESSEFVPNTITVTGLQAGDPPDNPKSNIIPTTVKIVLSVSAQDDTNRDRDVKSIERVAKYTALAAGFPENLAPVVEPSETEKIGCVYNDPTLAARMTAVFTSALGTSNVVSVKQQASADDFNRFENINGKAVPSLFFMLGATDPATLAEDLRTGALIINNHTPQFAPVADKTLTTGMIAMSSAVLDLLKPDAKVAR